jgi:ribose transport system substrate-binding protein
MKKIALALATVALCLSAGEALAAKKQLVILVKGLDNPFFEAIHQGCEKWNKENANSEYSCFYTGPASTSDEAGEAQILNDILGKPDTAAIAISPSNAPLIANTLRAASPKIPIMTVDADLTAADKSLRKTYLGTDNYQMGFKLGEFLAKEQPKGGQVCLIEGNAAADNILQRAAGTRAALAGKKVDKLNGENGWTETSGCPVFTNDDGPKGVQAMQDLAAANPKITSFAIMGGWPLFGAPQPYRQFTDQYKAKLASKDLVIVAADTIGDEMNMLKEKRVSILVGQRPFEMGYKAPTVMIQLLKGEKVADPVFTGLDECVISTMETCIAK